MRITHKQFDFILFKCKYEMMKTNTQKSKRADRIQFMLCQLNIKNPWNCISESKKNYSGFKKAIIYSIMSLTSIIYINNVNGQILQMGLKGGLNKTEMQNI